MRDLKPCGTVAAHQRHLSNGEQPCGPCRQARSDYMRAWQNGDLPARELDPCGTRGAYARHRRKGEEPCESCREATRHPHQAKRRLKDLYPDEFAKLRAEEASSPAGWARALAALVRNHPQQYRELLAEQKQAAVAELGRQKVGAA